MNQPPTAGPDWNRIDPGKDNGQEYLRAIARLPRAQRRALERQAKKALRKYRPTGAKSK